MSNDNTNATNNKRKRDAEENDVRPVSILKSQEMKLTHPIQLV